jgi:hypothetical protein
MNRCCDICRAGTRAPTFGPAICLLCWLDIEKRFNLHTKEEVEIKAKEIIANRRYTMEWWDRMNSYPEDEL